MGRSKTTPFLQAQTTARAGTMSSQLHPLPLVLTSLVYSTCARLQTKTALQLPNISLVLASATSAHINECLKQCSIQKKLP